MLNKFLKFPKFGPLPGRDTKECPADRPRMPEERSPSVVRIVHAGAKVEVYFMAIPACRIMEKYPSHFVTRPEVFRRPWDAVVKPDEILPLGKKYYVVPRRTVKKLRRRILRPSIVSRDDSNQTTKSYVSRSSNDVSIDSENETYVKSYVDSSDTSVRFRAGGRKIGMKKRVWFKEINENLRRSSPEDRDEDNSRKGLKPWTHGKRKSKLHALTWQPSLAAITETHE